MGTNKRKNYGQCLAPTDVADLQKKENIYSQLTEVVEKIQEGEGQILLSDCNAKVGSDNTDLKSGNNNMVIEGSLCPLRTMHKVTWVFRDGHSENQIDHIFIRRKWRRRLFDVANKPSANIDSD